MQLKKLLFSSVVFSVFAVAILSPTLSISLSSCFKGTILSEKDEVRSSLGSLFFHGDII